MADPYNDDEGLDLTTVNDPGTDPPPSDDQTVKVAGDFFASVLAVIHLVFAYQNRNQRARVLGDAEALGLLDQGDSTRYGVPPYIPPGAPPADEKAIREQHAATTGRVNGLYQRLADVAPLTGEGR